IKFINDSMMSHTMQLHGMLMQLEIGQPAVDRPNNHTIIIPPAKPVTALLSADEVVECATHCHLLYHISAGMLSKLVVANISEVETSTTPIQKSTTITSNQAEQQGDQHAHH